MAVSALRLSPYLVTPPGAAFFGISGGVDRSARYEFSEARKTQDWYTHPISLRHFPPRVLRCLSIFLAPPASTATADAKKGRSPLLSSFPLSIAPAALPLRKRPHEFPP